MEQQIRGLLFDKDGTLFDFQETWGGWAHAELRDLAAGDAAKLAAMAEAIGLNQDDSTFAPDSFVIAGTADEIVAALLPFLPDYTHDSLKARFDETTARAPQAEVVPLAALFERLKAAGFVLGISTNDAEGPARANLRSSNIEQLFDFVAGYDSGFGGKPEPGMQHAFCEASGLKPAEVAMVGDSTHDLLAGEAAGMLRIAVLTGVASHKDLAPFSDHVLPDIGHLPKLFGHDVG